MLARKGSPVHPAAGLRMIRPAELRRRYSRFALKNRLRHDAGLRIISVLLAIGLWIFVNGAQHSSVQSFNVPISYRGLPPGFVITNPHPDFVKMQITGPRTLLSLTEPNRLALRLDLNGVGVGQASFKIGPDSFNVLRGTSITGISPSQIVLDVDKWMIRPTPVRLNVGGKVASGYKIAASETSPPDVTLKGPSRALARIDYVQSEPFDVTGLAQDTSRELPLVAPGGMVRMSPAQVMATINLGPVIGDREYRGLPIAVRDNDYRTRVIPARVNITVRGAIPALNKLDLSGAAYVEADGMMPGTYNLPLQVKIPDGFEIVRQSAEKIRLIMYRQAARS
jgi:YbbR domain-containing protein